MKKPFSFRWGILPIFLLVADACAGQDAKDIRLNNYEPVSIYNTAQTMVKKARYPVIDLHSHDYPGSAEEVDRWVRIMDS
ncbi:MAG TPA: amidohydrolase, partial [Puia sp.]|nr:amidohydrolase [Puia sp.]